MTDIILVGACGRMGNMIASCAAPGKDCRIVAGIDPVTQNDAAGFPVYSDFSQLTEKADAIIDFSHISLTCDTLKYAVSHSLPVVMATTGHTDEQKAAIKEAAGHIPVFYSANMSVGVYLLSVLAKKATEVLGGAFDIEIVEQHHNQKLDAPSGTALMLANAVMDGSEKELHLEYDRHFKREKRTDDEIGIHSIRGGTIAGEHEIIFAGHDEIVTLSHSARSREIFAVGALRAAEFIKDKTAGAYSMKDIFE